MASIAYYSNLYDLVPNRGGTAVYTPRAATVDHKGGPQTYKLTITAGTALLNTDVVHLIPAVPAGTIVSAATIKNDDLDTGTTVTFGLGWTAAPTTFLSASTLFQSANTGTALTAAQIMGQTAAVAGDELVLTLSASSDTAGTIVILVTLVFP